MSDTTADTVPPEEPVPWVPPIIQNRPRPRPSRVQHQQSRVFVPPPPVVEDRSEIELEGFTAAASGVVSTGLDVEQHQTPTLEARVIRASTAVADPPHVFAQAGVATVTATAFDASTRVEQPGTNAPPPRLDTATQAVLVEVVHPDVLCQIEVVIDLLRRELTVSPPADRAVLHELLAELHTLNAQFHSPKPKKRVMSSSLAAVLGYAAGFSNNLLANATYDALKMLLDAHGH
jgi:hypothetical protein